MTRARRTIAEQQQLAIERADVLARKFWRLSRVRDQSPYAAQLNRAWMWFYLLEQAVLLHEASFT